MAETNLLTIRQATEYLPFSELTLYHLVRKGVFQAKREGRRIFLFKDEVLEYNRRHIKEEALVG